MEQKQKTSRFRMLIEDLLPSLGVQEGKIARWMLEHEKELVDTPIKDIAYICGVSQPSVVRLCKKLGCNGIKDLKILVDGITERYFQKSLFIQYRKHREILLLGDLGGTG